MNTADLIPFIRHIINEAAIAGDQFSNETDTAIKAFIRAAMTQLAVMPAYQGTPSEITDTSRITFSKRPDGLFYATIKPGSDFLRPVSVNLEGWVRPVLDFQPATGVLFLKQYSSALGIGSGPHSPVAFITKDDQNLIIAHAVKEQKGYSLRYIPVPEIAADGSVPVPECYREALSYTAAALYMQSINELSGAKSAFDTAASYIQTINSKTTDQQ